MMVSPNYSGTADYFERRAAKARGARRREQLQAIAKLYREKAQAGTARNGEGSSAIASRRERVAAMFRAFGDSGSIVRSARAESSPD